MHVRPYSCSSEALDPVRERKLLLNKREIDRIYKQLDKKGFTSVPLKVYFNQRGKVKLEIALCQGKQLYDKRQAIRERDQQKEMARAKKRFK